MGNYEVGEHRIMVIDLVSPSLQDINGYSLKKDEFIIADRVLKYYMNFDITNISGIFGGRENGMPVEYHNFDWSINDKCENFHQKIESKK